MFNYKKPTFNFQPTSTEVMVNEIKYNTAYESAVLFGREYQWIQMTERVKDSTFNESISREFRESDIIHGFVDDDTIYDGDDGFYGGFGNITQYSMLLHIPAKNFEAKTIREGDLIQFPDTNEIFEVSKIDSKIDTPNLADRVVNDSKQYNYKIYLSTYSFNTNDENIILDSDKSLQKELDEILWNESHEEKVTINVDEKETKVIVNEKESSNKISVDMPFGDL